MEATFCIATLVAPASQAVAAQKWRAVGGRGWRETVRGWGGGFDDLGAQAPIMAEEDAHRQAKKPSWQKAT